MRRSDGGLCIHSGVNDIYSPRVVTLASHAQLLRVQTGSGACCPWPVCRSPCGLVGRWTEKRREGCFTATSDASRPQKMFTFFQSTPSTRDTRCRNPERNMLSTADCHLAALIRQVPAPEPLLVNRSCNMQKPQSSPDNGPEINERTKQMSLYCRCNVEAAAQDGSDHTRSSATNLKVIDQAMSISVPRTSQPENTNCSRTPLNTGAAQ